MQKRQNAFLLLLLAYEEESVREVKIFIVMQTLKINSLIEKICCCCSSNVDDDLICHSWELKVDAVNVVERTNDCCKNS